MQLFINVLYHYTHHQRKIHSSPSIPNTKRDFSDSGMPGIKTSWLLSEFCNYFDSKASALWSKMSIGIVIDTTLALLRAKYRIAPGDGVTAHSKSKAPQKASRWSLDIKVDIRHQF